MSKTYKVHKYFDLDDLTTEKPCRCSGPKQSGFSIFERFGNATDTELQTFNSYNSSMNGTVFSEEDVVWARLKKSQCEV